MKRILSIFLAALFCISASLAAVTGVTAGEAADPDDNLVLHYDFEGATVEEKLKDKAPTTNGRVADDLNFLKGTTDPDTGEYLGITFANGYVTQKDSSLTKGNRTYFEQKTQASADMQSALEGNMTFIARFRMNSEVLSTTQDNDGYVYIFDARKFGESRPFNVKLQVSSKTLQVGWASKSVPNSDVTCGISFGDYDFTAAPWVTLVVTIGENARSSWDLKTYYVIGDHNGTPTWTNKNQSNQFENDGRAELTTNTARIFTNSAATGLCVDDIKLYNRVLTATEYNAITKAPAVRYGGFQDSAAYGETGSQKFDVRFVSTVNALDYRGVGMEVTRPDGTGTKTYTSTDTKTVYESLLGKTSANTPLRQVAASEFDAKYLFCLTVTGVPTGEDVVFTVKPFAILADGTTEYGDAYTVTFNADGTHKTAKIY